MQQRWERLLDRAETETGIAAEKMRAHRADRDADPARRFDQPAYGESRTAAMDEKRPAAGAPHAGSDEPTVQQPPLER
jgi:hypothetical protein